MRYQPGPFRTDDLLIAAVSAVLAWTITLALRTLFAGWTIRVLDTRPAQQAKRDYNIPCQARERPSGSWQWRPRDRSEGP